MKNRCVRKRNHHSRLSIDFFLSWWGITSRRLYLEFIDCWKNRFILYCTSDHVGLEICVTKLEEHTRMLIPITLSMPGSLTKIFTKFPLKDSFKLLDNITVERFQKLCSFARWRNVRAWAWYSAWLAYKTLHSHLQLEIFIEFVVDEFAKLCLP